MPSATGAYPSGTIFWRLDASTFTAASSSFTINANDQIDGSANHYSTPYTHNGMNLHGAKSVLVLHDTAASISGGANTIVKLYAQVLNI